MITVDLAPDATRAAPLARERFARLLRAELRKVRATRGPQWVLGIVGTLWVLVGTGAAVLSLVAGASTLSVSGALLGMGTSVVVFAPILGILIMAGDWQSRDVMTVFALEPRRHLVFWAKVTAAAALGVGLLVTAAVLAVIASTIIALTAAVPVTWDFDAQSAAVVLWGAGVAIASGIGYGAAVPRVAVTIVFVLVQGFVIDPLLSFVPEGIGDWFRLAAISDFGVSGEGLGPALVGFALWIVTPLAIGLERTRRADVQ